MESIPENLTYSNGSLPHPSTFTGISQLLDMAQDTIEIASFYWTMRKSDLPSPDGSSWQVRISSLPMQYTTNLYSCKNDNFSDAKNVILFLLLHKTQILGRC